MANSGPGSGPGLLRYFKPCRKNSCQISLPNLTGPLSMKVDSTAIQETNKEVSNYLERHGNIECNYLFQILPYFTIAANVITRVLHYVSAHDTVNLLLLNDSGFFRELHRPHYRESFLANNKKSMQT